MKKVIVVLSLVLGVVGVSVAQNTPANKPQMEHKRGTGERKALSPEDRATRQTDRMKEELGLSDKQYKDLLALNTKQALKADEHRKEMESKMEAKKEEMKAERKAYNEQLSKILTKEQLAAYELKKEERKAAMKNRASKPGSPREMHKDAGHDKMKKEEMKNIEKPNPGDRNLKN